MDTKIIKIDNKNIDQTKIKQAAQLLDDGKLVVFPTETVYGIGCRVKTNSLDRLNALKNRTTDKFYTLHIGQKSDVEKYVPSLNMRTKKLIENAWPGPVTIVFELSDEDIEIQRQKLEKEVFDNLYKTNTIGIRCPDNPAAIALLKQTKNPIIAPSANLEGQQPAINAKQALKQLSKKIDLIIDFGTCKYKKSSTVVKIKRKITILRQGVCTQEQLEKMSTVKILFVCTGNTCRSPMAEGFFKKQLAEKLRCRVDHLKKMGYKVSSAGTMGIMGLPASLKSVVACRDRNIDISSHKSNAVSKQLVDKADLIFVMSESHYEHILNICPMAANKCHLLVEGKSIPDPIGQSQGVYNNCAKEIEKAVKKRIGGLLI